MRIMKSVLLLAILAAVPVFAQGPPSYAPPQLDQMVSRIALYPDPLVAQILAGATYPDQIPDAARWRISIITSPDKLWPTRSRAINFPGIPAFKPYCRSLPSWK